MAVIEDSARHEVVIRVRDNGTGIQPETAPALFRPFEQADRTLARSQGGLGSVSPW